MVSLSPSRCVETTHLPRRAHNLLGVIHSAVTPGAFRCPSQHVGVLRMTSTK